MKISEIEEKMEREGFSEQLFSEFQSALKRVPKYLRSQHCYTTAYGFMKKDSKNAIRLIHYGLEFCENTWIDQMRSYLNLGGIYEYCGDYENAGSSYEAALSSIPEEQKGSYVASLSMDILRAEMHANHFTCTEYLRKLYAQIVKIDSFEAGLRHYIFYRAIAEIIIAKEDNDFVSLKNASIAAMQALDGDHVTSMDRILKRHKYKNEAHATKMAIDYLMKNKR